MTHLTDDYKLELASKAAKQQETPTIYGDG